ncbi:MAG TPA: T9SS type A sorting domain-containing protein [Candidatus Kapabacteria bacterium]
MKNMLLLIAVTIMAMPVSAQISFSSEEFIERYISSSASSKNLFLSSEDTMYIRSEINRKGSNASWDIRNRKFIEDTTDTDNSILLANPKDAPLSDNKWLKDATHVWLYQAQDSTDSDHYSFMKIDNTGIYTVGSVSLRNGVAELIFAYETPLTEYKLPLQFGTNWTSTSRVIDETGEPSMISHTRSGNVDGYGMVTTPKGSASTLRLHMKWRTSFFSGNMEFDMETNSFNWITKKGISATVTADSALKPSRVFMWMPLTSSVKDQKSQDNTHMMQLSNNPVSSGTTLSFTMPRTETVAAYLTDASGREVMSLFSGTATSGENSIALNTGTIPNGTYFVRLVTHGITSTQKLIIAK